MSFDYHTLSTLRQNHPAWRLLVSPHVPLIASFLQEAFVNSNVREISQPDLVELLEDMLFGLRDQLGDDAFPKSASEYLNDWAAPEKGWLRKFYRHDSDDAQFDLTPATEKAIIWLESLSQRNFVGTESRLLILFDLLKQLSEESSADPTIRLEELKKRKDEIDVEIDNILHGNLSVLDATAQKDRFMQFTQQARELLSDFREVEQNFRQLDRSVRERITQWNGQKGDLLENIMGERDAIADSDQGNSFQAFWDFLMSPQRQEEFSTRLEQVINLPAIKDLNPDKRTVHIHYDWLEAGEYTQRTVAQLSQQLRRFLDDQAWLENRRIMDILHGIENNAIEMRDELFSSSTPADFFAIADTGVKIELPMERPLFTPPIKAKIANIDLETGNEELDSSALFSQVIIDKAAIKQHIRQSLQDKSQISLLELCHTRPISQGLAELVAYLELAGDHSQTGRFQIVVDDSIEDIISWQVLDKDNNSIKRKACLPRIIYLRENYLRETH